MGLCLSRPHVGPFDGKAGSAIVTAKAPFGEADGVAQRSEASISIHHRSDTASADDGLADACRKADALVAWKQQQQQQQQQQQPLSSGDGTPASSASPAAVDGSDPISSSVRSGSDGSDPAAALRRRSPFADAKSPFTALAGIANPAVAGARQADAASSFRSSSHGGSRTNAEAAHDVASAAASCFADNCISADEDLTRGPPQPTPLRVADGSPARTASTPEEVAHIPGVVLPGELALLSAADLAGQPFDTFRRGPPIPPCDAGRVAEMARYGPLEGPAEPDPNVQHVLDLLCQVFRVENVLLALFGDHRIYIRNSKGFQRGDFPWRWSFCAWSMLPPEPEILLVEDTKQDARFTDNEVANTLGVRFYCGAPLLGSGGARLGTLCFVDSKPRQFAAEQLLILANLSEVVVRELEREIVDKTRRSRAETFMARALECFDAGVAFVDASQPEWRALHCSSAFTKVTGITTAAARAAPLWQLLCPPGGCAAGGPGAASWAAACAVMAGHRREFMLTGLTIHGRPELGAFTLRFRPAGRDALDEHTLPIGIPAQVASEGAGGGAGQFYFAILAATSPQDSGGLSSHASSRASLTASLGALRLPSAGLHQASGVLRPDALPFEGLELGPLVGRGSFGRVYRGRWQDRTVAVKICGPLGGGKTAYPDICKSVEAIASSKLAHPNIVKALRHCTILAHGAPSSSAPSMATVSEHSSSACAAVPPPAAAAAATVAVAAASTVASGVSGDGASGGSTTSGPGAALPSASSKDQLSAASEGGGGARKPRRRPAPAAVNPFAAANAARQLKATSAPSPPKPAFQSPFAAANSAKLTGSAPSSGAGSPLQGTPGSKPASKTPPPLLAFAAARSAALAVRDDSARSSMEDVTTDAPAAGSPGATSSASAASSAAAASPATSVMARQLAAAADRAAAGQARQRTAAGSSGSTKSGSGTSALSGTGSGSGSMAVTSAGSSIVSASSDATNADIETWLLLEYCDLGTLQAAVDKGCFRVRRATKDGPPALSTILAAAAEIAAAMAYLHGRGVVHGDLAGGNVLLCSAPDAPHGFSCKVSDFGLARLIALQGRITTDTYGTVTHMPPELLTGGDLSPAVDVYSFGVLLWEMCCGTRAWAGLSTAQVIMAVTVKGRKPAFPADTPPEFAVLADACMSADPAQRPTFAELEPAIARLRLLHPAA